MAKKPGYKECVVKAPLDCTLPEGFSESKIGHDQSVIAFLGSAVPFDTTCQVEQRYCYNGVLEGSFENPNCTIIVEDVGPLDVAVDMTVNDVFLEGPTNPDVFVTFIATNTTGNSRQMTTLAETLHTLHPTAQVLTRSSSISLRTGMNQK